MVTPDIWIGSSLKARCAVRSKTSLCLWTNHSGDVVSFVINKPNDQLWKCFPSSLLSFCCKNVDIWMCVLLCNSAIVERQKSKKNTKILVTSSYSLLSPSTTCPHPFTCHSIKVFKQWSRYPETYKSSAIKIMYKLSKTHLGHFVQFGKNVLQLGQTHFSQLQISVDPAKPESY